MGAVAIVGDRKSGCQPWWREDQVDAPTATGGCPAQRAAIQDSTAAVQSQRPRRHDRAGQIITHLPAVRRDLETNAPSAEYNTGHYRPAPKPNIHCQPLRQWSRQVRSCQTTAVGAGRPPAKCDKTDLRLKTPACHRTVTPPVSAINLLVTGGPKRRRTWQTTGVSQIGSDRRSRDQDQRQTIARQDNDRRSPASPWCGPIELTARRPFNCDLGGG